MNEEARTEEARTTEAPEPPPPAVDPAQRAPEPPRPFSVPAALPAARPGARRITSLAARGEPFVWLTGAGLAAAALMILGLLAYVLMQGAMTFWPRPLTALQMADGRRLLGEVSRVETFRPPHSELDRLAPPLRDTIAAAGGWSRRRLLRTGNYDLYGDDFVWVSDYDIVSESQPADAWTIERLEWGPAFGYVREIRRDGAPLAGGSAIGDTLPSELAAALDRNGEIRGLERNDIAEVNLEVEAGRLAIRKAVLKHGEDSPEAATARAEVAGAEAGRTARYEAARQRIEALRAESARTRIVVEDAGGRLIPERVSTPDEPLQVGQVVRAFTPNALGSGGRLKIFLSRWREFLTAEPREANTEGGVFPAIFGTFLMTVIMSLAVAPFGVIAALYLREYARQGALVSIVRIAVNNLAGVPSIVFGVFGLGFFCYLVGGRIDTLFFPERLPAPTFGTGGILWASLTLALLTVPVVIVSTEEALAAVPRSMREGSYACGASKWQTIRRIVIPRATPGIMTGLILAMARGAGEVAPLMITGVVKLAPQLPFDGHFPFVHLERSFMHLGFHIYDVGFQSRNSEAGKPMVFTTTLLLIALIALLNLSAIQIRTRLRRRFQSAHF